MNSLTDLRRTLDLHAEDVADPAAVARTTAVHHRIAVVRRRRRAAVAGTATFVLLAGVAGLLIPRGSSHAVPTAPTLLGEQAPAWEKSLGFRYDTDGSGESFTGSGSIRVAKSDQPQLYSWTTSQRTRVDVTLPDGRVWVSHRSHFSDYVVVPPGEAGTLKLAADEGQVAVASYRLSDVTPEGYTKDGTTFREDVAGAKLLRAMVSDRGQTEMTSSFVLPHGALGLALVCSGLPRGYAVHVSVDGFAQTSPSEDECRASRLYDAGAGVSPTFRPVSKPGTRVSVRMWVTRGGRDLATGSVPDLRMGAGVYGQQVRAALGSPLPDEVEYLGHTWTQTAGITGQAPGEALQLPPAAQGRLAAVSFRTHGPAEVRFRAGTSRGGGTFLPDAGTGTSRGAIPNLWAPAGTTVHASLSQGRGRYTLVTYLPEG